MINMASEPAARTDYDQLCTAPDHVVDMVLSLLRPATNPADVSQARARLGEARAWANRIWAEAAHAGAVWGLSRAPLKIQVTDINPLALGDMIRRAQDRAQAVERPT